MIKNKRLIVGLILLLVLAAIVAYFLMNKDNPKVLKPGDTDPKTGCVVGSDGIGELCNNH